MIESFGIKNISASYVSGLASGLDVNAKEFPVRPMEYPVKFLYIDAPYFKVCENGRYGNKVVYVSIG